MSFDGAHVCFATCFRIELVSDWVSMLITFWHPFGIMFSIFSSSNCASVFNNCWTQNGSIDQSFRQPKIFISTYTYIYIYIYVIYSYMIHIIQTGKKFQPFEFPPTQKRKRNKLTIKVSGLKISTTRKPDFEHFTTRDSNTSTFQS